MSIFCATRKKLNQKCQLNRMNGTKLNRNFTKYFTEISYTLILLVNSKHLKIKILNGFFINALVRDLPPFDLIWNLQLKII